MKFKSYYGIILAVIIFSAASAKMFSQAPPVTTVGISSHAAGTYSVPITVSGFNNVGTVSLTLIYNPAEVVYTGVTLNAGLQQANPLTTPVSDQSGKFRFSCFSQNPIVLSAPTSTLLTLTFTVQPGFQGSSSALTWSTAQGDCDITPPPPGVYNPPISVSNMSTYFINGSITIVPASKTLNLTLFLEGLYISSGVMRQAQGNSGNQFPGNTSDKIVVELHSSVAGNYSNILFTATNIDLCTTGQASLPIPTNLNGSYYITVKNRNSLTTVSGTPVSFAGSSISYDFSTAATKAFGSNMKSKSGIWVFYGGDVNQDELIDISDMISVDNLSALATTGYLPSDVNGDGLIDITDMVIVDNNSSQAIGIITP